MPDVPFDPDEILRAAGRSAAKRAAELEAYRDDLARHAASGRSTGRDDAAEGVARLAAAAAALRGLADLIDDGGGVTPAEVEQAKEPDVRDRPGPD